MPSDLPTSKEKSTEQVVVNTTGWPSVKITGTVFEEGPNGWCKHCLWARAVHVIGATTGKLYCPADEK